jgi:outer membrane protein OmpA-like peptidoglycan-associated protein
MQKLRPAIFTAIIAMGAIGLSGCATKDYVNEQVYSVDAKVQSNHTQVQASLEQQQAKLAQVDQTSREALDRATAAGKLAEGKFLYSMVLSDDSVKFPVDSAKLSPEAEQRLTSFVEQLNQRLGQERAETVRKFMSKHGVPLNRMSTISYGKEEPVADNKTRTGRSQNRRVVLVVMS